MDHDKEGNPLSDDEIITLYRQRDERAIRETDKKYGHMLFRIGYNILHDRGACEECQNDTYLSIWQSIPPTAPAVFSAFAAGIMRHKALDRHRRRASGKRIPAEATVPMEELFTVSSDTGSPEDDYAAKELGRAISDFVRALPDVEQDIFLGRFYLCDTVSHIARELKLGVATVHRTQKRLLYDLQGYLKEMGYLS